MQWAVWKKKTKGLLSDKSCQLLLSVQRQSRNSTVVLPFSEQHWPQHVEFTEQIFFGLNWCYFIDYLISTAAQTGTTYAAAPKSLLPGQACLRRWTFPTQRQYDSKELWSLQGSNHVQLTEEYAYLCRVEISGFGFTPMQMGNEDFYRFSI